MATKAQLLDNGQAVMRAFCAVNEIQAPPVTAYYEKEKWAWGMCAYYRPARGIVMSLPKCAAIGTAGRQWSFPGYTVDRTPYGVVQHELGHHVDWVRSVKRGPYFGDFSIAVRGQAGEKPITSYAPNDAEWFAEMFRVFVTNPDMLRIVRPRTYRELCAAGLKPVFTDTWRDRLAEAPARTITAAERQVERLAA